jgi:hypothetical protein
MVQLQSLLPALGASGLNQSHALWWLLLLIIVFSIVAPIAYLASRNDPRQQRH